MRVQGLHSPPYILLSMARRSPTPANRDTVLRSTAGAIYAALRASTQGDFMNASNERMSVFGPTLRFKGELKAQEDIKIEGRIEGTIHHQQRVIVGAKGEVVATVNAASIDVEGKVQGDMSARKSVKVSQTAVVRGNIRAPSVSITEGANFNGGVTMESNAGSQGSSNPGASR
jgi:cytoskeletal protein CcmA (bactofilin family)